jgi:hypothetical protein
MDNGKLLAIPFFVMAAGISFTPLLKIKSTTSQPRSRSLTPEESMERSKTEYSERLNMLATFEPETRISYGEVTKITGLKRMISEDHYDLPVWFDVTDKPFMAQYVRKEDGANHIQIYLPVSKVDAVIGSLRDATKPKLENEIEITNRDWINQP